MMETTVRQNLVAGALSPADARALTKEAYIYGFPIVDSYRIVCPYFVDPNNLEFKAPWKFKDGFPDDATVKKIYD